MEAVITFIFGKAVPTTAILYAVKIFWDIRKAMWEVVSDYKSQKKECDGKFNVMGNEITHIKDNVKEHGVKISKLEEATTDIKVKWNEKWNKDSEEDR